MPFENEKQRMLLCDVLWRRTSAIIRFPLLSSKTQCVTCPATQTYLWEVGHSIFRGGYLDFLQEILSDPAMRIILEQMQENPLAAQK